MWNKIVLSFFFIISISSFGQKEGWIADFPEAFEQSVNTGKPILANFTGSDWCGWCIRLKREVFNFPEFKKWTDDNVVLVELDFPRRKKLPENIMRQNRELANVFAVRGYPTVWIVKPEIIENSKVNFLKMGTLGYVAGGPKNWIAKANNFLPKQ